MDVAAPGAAEQRSADDAPRRSPEDIPEFGSDTRQIDKQAGLCFRLHRPDRPQPRQAVGTRHHVLDPAVPDGEDEDEEEILVIEGVTVPCTQTSSFNVFLNLPNADKKTPLTVAEYAGTYYHMPHAAPAERETVTNMRLGIGDTLKQLGITDLDHLVVTLVYAGAGPDDTPIALKGARIEYE